MKPTRHFYGTLERGPLFSSLVKKHRCGRPKKKSRALGTCETCEDKLVVLVAGTTHCHRFQDCRMVVRAASCVVHITISLVYLRIPFKVYNSG